MTRYPWRKAPSARETRSWSTATLNPSENNQIHFWGQADRVAYVNAINTVLSEYLSSEISIEKAGE